MIEIKKIPLKQVLPCVVCLLDLFI